MIFTASNMLTTRFLFAILLFGCGLAATKADYLPALHQIQSYTFSVPYSCNGFYNTSALFLSTFSQRRNAPDLLYNGACGSQPYFQSNTAGDDFAVISLIGNVSLDNVTADMAIGGLDSQGSSSFKQTQLAIPSMTYAALLSKSDIRALFTFHIKSINASNGFSCDIEYAVLSYMIQDTVVASPGWSWYTHNTYSQTPSAFEVPVSVPVSTPVDNPADSLITIIITMGTVMGAVILGLFVVVIVLGVKLRHRSGYSHIQH